LPGFFSDLVPTNSSGAAIAIEEYVPTITPKQMANVSPRRPAPPKMYIISTTMNVVKEVNRVREIV
jgi:hypothetical protein